MLKMRVLGLTTGGGGVSQFNGFLMLFLINFTTSLLGKIGNCILHNWCISCLLDSKVESNSILNYNDPTPLYIPFFV